MGAELLRRQVLVREVVTAPQLLCFPVSEVGSLVAAGGEIVALCCSRVAFTGGGLAKVSDLLPVSGCLGARGGGPRMNGRVGAGLGPPVRGRLVVVRGLLVAVAQRLVMLA
ncbi:MAG: hypothetical protein H0U20_02405 [Thermoleophilaceae bacterium]|nr:hypothetical protein [Thermoleophilaceae bacterium]